MYSIVLGNKLLLLLLILLPVPYTFVILTIAQRSPLEMVKIPKKGGEGEVWEKFPNNPVFFLEGVPKTDRINKKNWCWLLGWFRNWLVLIILDWYADWSADWCWLMLTDAFWCWLIVIDADWCWLILIDDDWYRLMMTDAFWCWLIVNDAD